MTPSSEGERRLSSDLELVERVIRTCRQMFEDRGYERVERLPFTSSFADCQPVLRGKSVGPAREDDGDDEDDGEDAEGGGVSGGTIEAYLHDEERVGIRQARAILSRSKEGTRIVVVSRQGPTPFTKKNCSSVPIEFFTVRETQENITRHVLVPRHSRASADDPAMRGARSTDLPRILTTDPVVRYYGWSVGTIVRVDRLLADEEVPFFRLVVSP